MTTFRLSNITKTKTFSELSVSEAFLSIKNMDADVLTLRFDFPYNATSSTPGAADVFDICAVTSPPSRVYLMLDSPFVFSGAPQYPNRSAGPSDQYLSIEILGPWHQLENTTVYSTYTDAVTGATRYQSKLSLSGTATSMLSSILSCAPTGYFQYGYIDIPAIELPPKELDGVTIAQALKSVLAYFPGSQVIFDYDYSPPKMHVLKADSIRLASITPAPESADGLRYTLAKKTDVSGVTILYTSDIIDAHGDVIGREEVQDDSFPSPFTPSEPGRILISCSTGKKLSFVGTNVTQTAGYYLGLEGDLWEAGFYSRCGALMFVSGNRNLPVATIQINIAGTQTLSSWVHSVAHPYCRSWNLISLESLSPSLSPPANWLDAIVLLYKSVPTDSGHFPDDRLLDNDKIWFGKAVINSLWVQRDVVGSSEVQFTVYLAYAQNIPGGFPNGIKIEKFIGEFSVAPAAGIAQRIYTDAARQYHEGSYSGAPLAIASPLSRLMLIDSVSSPIQQATHDLFAETTSYTFGPPSHLSPQDFISLSELQ